MFPWELSLTELRPNGDLTYSTDLKHAPPLLPNCLISSPNSLPSIYYKETMDVTS